MQSCKLYSLQNSSLVELYIHLCQRLYRCWKRSWKAFCRKPFQLFRHILNDVSMTKAPPLQCWFQARDQVETSWSQIRRVWGILHFFPHCSLLRGRWQNPTGVLEHCEGVTNCWFPIFRGVSFTKATRDVSIHFFIYSSNACKLYQRIRRSFWSCSVNRHFNLLWSCYFGTLTMIIK